MSILAVAAETSAALIAAGAAIGGAIIGGLITFLTTLLQGRQARAERQAAAVAERRARLAEILGRANTFLTDVQPERIGFNVDPEKTPMLMSSLSSRLNPLRDELSIFAAADEDDRVTSAATRLEVALFNTFNRVRWHAADLLGNRDALSESLEAAKREHLKATTLVRITLALVRGRDVDELEELLTKIDAPGVGS